MPENEDQTIAIIHPIGISDSPPDDQIQPNQQLPAKSHEDDGKVAPMTVHKGRGRPKVDGTPNKTSRMAPAPTPTPPYRRFYVGGGSAQRPQALLNWIWEVPTWARERMTLFVNRDWPVLVHISQEMKETARKAKQQVEHNYIDKLTGNAIIHQIEELRDKYGAGDYSMILTDDTAGVGGGSGKIADVTVRENWRDIRTFPPADRRIDRPHIHLDLYDKGNQSFVAYLRAKGALPEESQKKEAADMADVTSIKAVTDFAREMINRDNRQAPDAAQAAKVVAEAAERGFEIIAKSKEVADQSQASHDPLASMDKIVGIIDKIRPSQQTDSGLMGIFLAQLSEMNKTVISIQNDRIQSTERMLTEIKAERAATANPAVSAATDPMGDGLERLLKYATLLGFKVPGRGAVAADVGGGGIDWRELLSDIVPHVSGLVQSGFQAWQTKMYIDAQARGLFTGAGMPMPIAPPPPIQPMAPNPARTAANPVVDTDSNTVIDNPEDDAANFLRFMGEIRRPLLNHINRNLGGDAFAQFLIDMYDEATYEQIRQQGPDTFLMALQSYQPIATEIVGKEIVVKKLVKEFMEYDPEAVGVGEEEESGMGAV